MKVIEVDDLCVEASISLAGQVAWGEAVPHVDSGVYVIVAPQAGHKQNIVYIGRAKRLRRRLKQFYRHVYGKKSPHRGGCWLFPPLYLLRLRTDPGAGRQGRQFGRQAVEYALHEAVA